MGFGGAWSRQGVIVFAGAGGVLQRVAASGGQPVPVTRPDAAKGEKTHRWPSFLPDGRHFLYLARNAVPDKSALCAGSLDAPPGTAACIELVRTNSSGSYVPSRGGGWLLFQRDGSLWAQRFDAAGLKVEREAIPVVERIGFNVGLAVTDFSTSETGVLVYGGQRGQVTRLVWSTRDGKQSAINTKLSGYMTPRLSPDGTRLATDIRGVTSADIWQIDLAHGISSRFTFDARLDISPIWSPDGKQIAFAAMRGDHMEMRMKPSSGGGSEEVLASASGSQVPTDWSRDGRYILFVQRGAATGLDLWALDVAARKAIPVVQTPFEEQLGQFSPDGRWVAYGSDESGRPEIYVGSFPGGTAKFQVSNNGGRQPRWRGDGKELYYLDAQMRMMAVTVKAAAGALEREPPRVLFEAPWMAIVGLGHSYDVTQDGQRFISLARAEGVSGEPLTLVTNWPARLRE
jgi:Tol biopolymer transport system component